jgi:hypothetical protein
VKLAVIFVAAAAGLPVAPIEAQRCPYAAAWYVVHSEDGKVLDEADLKTVYEQSPKPVGDDDTGVFLGSLLLQADGTYAHPNFAKAGSKIPVLDFHGRVNDCFVHLREVTLIYHQRRMQLIFDIDLVPVTFGEADDYRRNPKLPNMIVIDGLPFREGTFRLDAARWLAQFTRWAESTQISPEFWVETPGTP